MLESALEVLFSLLGDLPVLFGKSPAEPQKSVMKIRLLLSGILHAAIIFGALYLCITHSHYIRGWQSK